MEETELDVLGRPESSSGGYTPEACVGGQGEHYAPPTPRSRNLPDLLDWSFDSLLVPDSGDLDWGIEEGPEDSGPAHLGITSPEELADAPLVEVPLRLAAENSSDAPSDWGVADALEFTPDGGDEMSGDLWDMAQPLEAGEEAEVELPLADLAPIRPPCITLPLVIPCGQLEKLLPTLRTGGTWGGGEEDAPAWIRERVDHILALMDAPAALSGIRLSWPGGQRHRHRVRVEKYLWVLDTARLEQHVDARTRKSARLPAAQLASRLVRQGSRKYRTIHLLLHQVAELLRTGTRATKRELYYRHPEFFQAQGEVDQTMLLLTATFGVPRHAFHVTASAKGLVAGNAWIQLRGGGMIHCASHGGQTGINIPCMEEIVCISTPCTKVLVVEKEAVFQLLLSLGFGKEPDWLLVTGKGYPDVSTLEFVRALSTPTPTGARTRDGMGGTVLQGPSLQAFALMDFDVYGIEIYLTYRFGSKAMAVHSSCLSCPTLRWIGLGSTHLQHHVLPAQQIALSPRDRLRAVRMLHRSYLRHAPEIRDELRRMLMYGRKTETEGVEPAALLACVHRGGGDREEGSAPSVVA